MTASSPSQPSSRRSPLARTGVLCALLALILLPGARAFADATGITASFQSGSTWQGGYNGTLTIRNGGGSAVKTWTATLQSANPITDAWNATCKSSGGTLYALTPASWTTSIAVNGSIAIGFTFSGNGVVSPSTLTFNGQAVTISGAVPTPTPTPSPTPGVTPTPAPTPTPSAAAPGKPTISVLQDWTNGGYGVTWAVYSGGAATTYQLLEDGTVYTQGAAPAAANGSQTATIGIHNRPYGAHSYQIVLTNAAGTSSSSAASYAADGASKIIVGAADAAMQARQVTVALNTTTSYALSVVDGSTGSFQLASNNDTVISYSMQDARTLLVTGLAPGRASLRITNTVSGESRWLGVRVKNADGTLPGMPNYLALGSVSEDTTPALTMWRQFGAGDKNRRVDARYIYLNDGPSNTNPYNWYGETQPHGFRATSYVRESLKLGIIPFFVWYNLDGTGDGFYTDTANVQNDTFMQGYFADMITMCNLARAEGGDEMIGIVIEPDFIGYLAQNSVDPTTFPASVSSAYTAGVLKHGVDPEFPNTITGLVKAINYVFSKNLPQAYFGWEFALWASPPNGWTVPTGAKGVNHLTDTLGLAQGRYDVAREATAITDYYLKAGVASYGASFVSVDKYGLDAGAEGKNGDPASSTWFWNETHWLNYLTFVDAMALRSQLPVVLWQIPVGHVNSSQSANPDGGLFPDLVNNSTHYEDSAGSFFFGDTFLPGTGNRFAFFSTTDPLNAVTTSGNAVTWPAAMSLAANHGVRAVLFGAGVGDSTNGVGTPPTDSGWWITGAQRYLQKPVALAGTSPLPTPPAGVSPTPTPVPTPGVSPTPTPVPTPTPSPNPTGVDITVKTATTMVNFHVDSDWGSGFQGTYTLTNLGTTPLTNWRLNFTMPVQISSVWNASVESQANGVYRLAPASWDATLAPNVPMTVGFIAAPGSLTQPPGGITLTSETK